MSLSWLPWPLKMFLPAPRTGLSGLDIDKAVTHLDDSAEDDPTHSCAKYVRLAIKAGGITLVDPPRYAKDYAATLGRANFVAVPVENYKAEAGDIAVIQNYRGGHVAGHIAMYDGKVWVSDFKQRDMWGGPGYRKAKPAYVIYRP